MEASRHLPRFYGGRGRLHHFIFWLSPGTYRIRLTILSEFACRMSKEPEVNFSPQLAAIKAGIHYSFVEVYHALHAKVFRFYLKRVLQPETAKELTQQCFIRLWEYRHTLTESLGLEIQLFIIARSILINHLKKESTRKRFTVVHLQENGVDEILPDHRRQVELTGEVNAAIKKLPPIRKRVIMLKAFRGFSNKEIAAEMNISLKTVEDHVTKAFRHIRQTVTTYFF